MTRHVAVLTAAAETDIRNIARYIGQDSPASARKFAVEVSDALDRLCELPMTGHAIHGFEKPLLLARVSARFRHYLICYSVIDDSHIRIVRVLHGARNLVALLTGEA